jgi:hypothetical protein
MSETFLRIGDEIFLYDDHDNLLVSENPLETRACARPPARHCLPSEALGTAIFKLEPQQTYKVQRELEHFNESISFYETDKSNLKLLEQRALKESQQNEAEQRRLLGKPILYGQVIQLFNPHFKKYLTVSGKTCRMDVSHLQVNLATASSVGYFRIMPRYRIRVDGEPVRLGDTVALQCVRPDGYLNVDHEKPTIQLPFEHEAAYEVYSHTRISSWTMKLHSSTLTDQDTSRVKYTNSGQYVRFYHKEMESYLEAPVIHG